MGGGANFRGISDATGVGGPMLEEGLVERSDEKEISGRSSDPGAAGGEPPLRPLSLL